MTVAPKFYIHPNYLVIEQVLDLIGQAMCKKWDSNYINSSKTCEEITVKDALGVSKRLNCISIMCFPSESEENEARAALNNVIKSGKFAELVHRSVDGSERRTKIKNSKISIQMQRASLHTALEADHTVKTSSSKGSNFAVELAKDEWTIDLGSELERTNLENLLNLSEVRNKLRDALVDGKKLCAYIKQDGQFKPVSSDLWEDEKQWCRLLIEGYIKHNNEFTGLVYFFRNEIDSFADALLHQSIRRVSDDEKLVSLLLKQLEEGKRRLRGAERLYLIAKTYFEEEVILKGKQSLEFEIQKLATSDNLKLKVISNPQTEGAKEENKKNKDSYNQNNVTEQEIKDIAKFIRPL